MSLIDFDDKPALNKSEAAAAHAAAVLRNYAVEVSGGRVPPSAAR